jgi:PII-like signaling protein
VNDDCLKLTTYFSERHRATGKFLADALTDVYARNQLETSLVLRGIEGFGLKHQLRTDRLLTLSEDLPVVSVAVDARKRIESALADVNRLGFSGLVTLERARMLTGRIESVELPPELHQETKLTVYVGRHERANGAPAYKAVVDALRAHGVAGATVLLGVDGTAHGVRHRARFVGRNVDVPLMIIAVGDGHRIAELLPEIGAMLTHPVITLERACVCKRDGQRLADPRHLPETDDQGLGVWQKLMVYVGEEAEHGGHPVYLQIVRQLRRAGAAGATCLRGFWGFHGEHEPHGDSFLQLRRRVPVVTVVVDTPERIREWFSIIDELTSETGLVTSEMVPAFRATAPEIERGGLRLARLRDRGQ